jgi:hypothetical protein
MTDRLAGVIVTFERDVRVDDAEPTITALQQIKGVVSVEPVVADARLHMAEERARFDLRARLWEALR